MLSPESFHDQSIYESMRLRKESSADSDGADVWFRHGLRRVNLVGFERRGRLSECVAFDPSVEGFAQVRSVWPGQVADFFSRHAPERARDLFMTC
jgi:hypothetical protein